MTSSTAEHIRKNGFFVFFVLFESGQKLIATHSGDLLSEVDVGSIRRLHRVGVDVKVGMLPTGLLRDRERQKFDFLVRRTRGELFFARCWLLGEGETEAILFAGAAELLGVDLEHAGVRCVEYRQGDISYFLDAANSLGIAWHFHRCRRTGAW